MTPGALRGRRHGRTPRLFGSAFVGTTACVLVMGAPAPAAARICGALPAIADVVAADDRSRSSDAYEDERALRDFALFWYRNLASDVVDGHGLSIEVVTEAFGPACEDETVIVAWLRELLLTPGSATDFSRRLAVAHALALEHAKD